MHQVTKTSKLVIFIEVGEDELAKGKAHKIPTPLGRVLLSGKIDWPSHACLQNMEGNKEYIKY